MESGGPGLTEVPAIGLRLEELLGCSVLPGHRIQTLINGKQIFPAMLQAISAANDEICFETFIYWSGEIARQFATSLSDAAARGVCVHVLLDWWGAQKMDSCLIAQMCGAGVTVRHFNPLRWWQFHRMNYRTHRKILVIDREVAFTGGVGIAQEWQGDAKSPNEWHDLHYRITGPVVRDMRNAFEELWSEVLQQAPLPANIDRPPIRDGCDTVAAQVLTSSPREGSELTFRLFRHAIDTAAESILLITAYFVPDQDMINALISAARRGVSVEVMVPGPHIDSNVVRYSSRSSWGGLLQAGLRIHVYQPTMLHAKAMIIDGCWVIVGSANFDNRSFSLNDEITLNVFSRDFAATHTKIFHEDLERCEPFTYLDWRSRGLLSRCKELLSDALRPHL